MPTNNPHTNIYTASDLLRYATGRMTAPEMYALEKAALEDPFLAEALEGYREAAEAYPQLQTNIDKLTLAATKQREENKIVPLWRKKAFQYAVAATVVLGGGWATYSLLNPAKDEQQSVASASEQTKDQIAKGDTIAMNSATNSAPVNQAPAVVAEQDQKANLETFKTPDDAPKQKMQEPALPDAEAPLLRDSIEMQKSDHTNVATNEVAKKEMKDEAPPVSANKPSPVITENSSSYKLDTRRRSETASRSKSTADVEPRNTFRGRITDAKNNPLPYANVMITGENIGTYTDSKGAFNIIYDDSVLPVRTRSLGYESQTVQMKAGNREQQIIMPEDEKLKESLLVVTQKPQGKQTGLKPLIIETDSLSSAQPVVGLIDYNTYLLNNNRISELPLASRSVELSFEVDKRGEVKNITVEQSSGKELDAEAIRLLKEGPKWKSNRGGTGRARVKVKL